MDYLKIDIEYWEWDSLETALKDGSLKNVKQLGIEFHRDELMYQKTSFRHYIKYFNVFQGLRNAGFYKWFYRLNPLSMAMYSIDMGGRIDCCYEFVYLNLNFLNGRS